MTDTNETDQDDESEQYGGISLYREAQSYRGVNPEDYR